MKKQILVVGVLLCLVWMLAGCFGGTDKITSYTVSGEVQGAQIGQVLVGDTVAAVNGQNYSVLVSTGTHTLKVLDVAGKEVYQEQINVAQNMTKNVDLSLVGLTAEQLAEINMKKAETENMKKNWDQVKAKLDNTVDVKKGEVSLQAVAGCIGSYGDILVTLDGLSSGSSAWAGGHAGLVEDSNTVIECFGNKGDLNGVRRWPNDWANRYSDVTGLRIYGATLAQYSAALAEGQKHIGKPYNYNFFYISTTNSFYCSQLCWRAWVNQGYDLNDGGAVWPVDLIESAKTYAFYAQ